MGSISYDRFDVEASDEAALPVHRWRPAAPRSAVIALHGATSHGGWFATLAAALGARGVATYAPDRRGSGLVRALGLPADPMTWVDDLRRVIAMVARENEHVVLLPWCFAAKLAVPALAGNTHVRRMVLVAPAFFFSRAVASGFEQALARGNEFPVPSPDDAFVSAPHALAFLASDPLRWRTMTRAFTELSRALLAETRAALPQLAVPTTAVFASGDRIVDNDQGKALVEQHRISARVIEGSHGFFLDDPSRAADLLEPMLGSE